MDEISLYVQIFITLTCTIAYILTYRYQAKKLTLMDNTILTLTNLINGQSKIISDFEKYKSIFDIDDFEKRLKLKLDNQREELNQNFKKEAKKIQQDTISEIDNSLRKESSNWMSGWNELAQIALNIIIKQFPNKSDKTARNAYIAKNYPSNANYFIGFMDDYLDGKIKSEP